MQTKLNKAIACFMAIIMVIGIAPMAVFNASASSSGQCGDNVYYTLDDNGTLTVRGKGAIWNYSWDASPFYDDYSIENVIIENGVTAIGDYALFHCKNLKSVVIPTSVTAIGGNAFALCSSLASLTIPNSVTAIGDSAFGDCSSLKSVTIPSSVKTFGSSVFSFCYNLTSAVFADGAKSIGESMFYDCSRLSSVTIPNSVTSIGQGAFTDCIALKSITIPDSVTSIGDFAFYGCGLENVTIPSSVTRISRGMFYYCGSLKSITVPGSVKSIEGYAFFKANNLTDVYYTGTQKQWNAISIAYEEYDEELDWTFNVNEELSNATIHFSEEHTHAYTPKVTKKATASANGTIAYTCPCGDSYTKSIAKVSTIKLSATSYTYDGKEKKPTVTVKDSSGKALKSGTDYTVTYASGRKNPGSYTVKVTLKGNYSGSKTLTFKISLATVTSLKASTQTTTSVTLSWKKVTGTTGYQVYKYNSSKKAYVKVKAVTGTSYKVTGLKAGTDYKFKVRAYKKIGSEYVYGGYSLPLSAATKPSTPTLKVTAGSKKATLSWNKISAATGYQIQYSTSSTFASSKTKDIPINKNGTTSKAITGLKNGTKYYFRIRAYKTVTNDGKSSKVYSAWSSVKNAVPVPAGKTSIILNTSTKTFHVSSTCSAVKRMSAENKSTVKSTVSGIKGCGYKACGTCSKSYK